MPLDYAAPDTLEGAISLLAHAEGARILAGGQGLLPDLKLGLESATLLVDLTGLANLRTVTTQPGGGIRIGAMVTLSEVAENGELQGRYRALTEAAAAVGDRQLRNRATLGGALLHTAAGLDLPAAVIALDGTVNLRNNAGNATMAPDTLQVNRTGLGPAVVLTSIDLPDRLGGSAYVKFPHPASHYAICGVAAHVSLTVDGSVGSCRFGLTGATERPQHMSELEAALEGKKPGGELISEAMGLAVKELTCVSDLAASAEYRGHLVDVLARQALSRALEDAARLAPGAQERRKKDV